MNGSSDVACRAADAFLRQPDPFRLIWKVSGATRHKQFLFWNWEEREEIRLVYSHKKGWWIKLRWVLIKFSEAT